MCVWSASGWVPAWFLPGSWLVPGCSLGGCCVTEVSYRCNAPGGWDRERVLQGEQISPELGTG